MNLNNLMSGGLWEWISSLLRPMQPQPVPVKAGTNRPIPGKKNSN
jgi:hypothetical protein